MSDRIMDCPANVIVIAAGLGPCAHPIAHATPHSTATHAHLFDILPSLQAHSSSSIYPDLATAPPGQSPHFRIDLPRPPNNFHQPAPKIALRSCKNRNGGLMTNPHSSAPRKCANRANALLSTGPRTAAGKQRSSLNALTHGLTSRDPVLATESPAAYQRHRRQFFEEYQPATPTETQLTQELIDTAWRLNRIPSLETALLHRAANPPSDQAAIDFDIVDAHRALATLGLHGQRLSRQFQKTLENLREIQSDRRREQERELKRAAAVLEMHKRKGIPYNPAQDGFVFSSDQIEAFSQRMLHLNESRQIEHVLFHMPMHPGASFATPAAWERGMGNYGG
jgi:hypothetical protein